MGWWTALKNRFKYPLLARLIHQPGVLLAVGRLLRGWMLRGRLLRGQSMLVSGRRSVVALLERTSSFSNLAHHDDLPEAIDFVIGMDGGPHQRRERKVVEDMIASPQRFADGAAAEARARCESLGAKASFDLIDDYLTHVAWAALRTSFGDAAGKIEADDLPAAPGCPSHLFLEMRHVGAQLIGGQIAPAAVRDRAASLARDLNARIHRCRDALERAWQPCPTDGAALERNAVGLMWVGHPAMVQSGALVMQSLLADVGLYRGLRQVVAAWGTDAWSSTFLREELRAHVLELMRFRPAFPLLNRSTVRDTLVDADGRPEAVAAGETVGASLLGAMFDPQAVAKPRMYWPGRPDSAFGDPADRMLMFGYGDRSCPAKDHVVETLVSALIGLLLMPELRYRRHWSRIEYDGPIITHLGLRPRARPSPGV